jgi:hypothetical protein
VVFFHVGSIYGNISNTLIVSLILGSTFTPKGNYQRLQVLYAASGRSVSDNNWKRQKVYV